MWSISQIFVHLFWFKHMTYQSDSRIFVHISRFPHTTYQSKILFYKLWFPNVIYQTHNCWYHPIPRYDLPVGYLLMHPHIIYLSDICSCLLPHKYTSSKGLCYSSSLNLLRTPYHSHSNLLLKDKNVSIYNLSMNLEHSQKIWIIYHWYWQLSIIGLLI